MRKTWMVLLTLGLVAIAASAAWADDLTGRIGLGLGGGIYGLAGNRDSVKSLIPPASNAKLGLQFMPISLKWGIQRHITLEFANFHYGWNGSKLAGEENYRTYVRPLTLNFLFPLMPNNQFVPYLQAGGGVLFWTNTFKDTTGGGSERSAAIGTQGASAGRKLENQDPMGSLGAGFEYFMGGATPEERNHSIEGRFTYSFFDNLLTDVGQHDNNNRLWMATLALNFYSKKGAVAPPPPAPAPPETTVTPPPPAPAPPETTTTPPPPPAPPAPCIQEGALEGVYFDFDKSVVKPEFNPTLNDLADKLVKDCPTVELRLDGHCDTIGADGYNMRLGMRRARAVKNYLVKRGVQPPRLTTQSFGWHQPAVPNTFPNGKDNPANRAKNRRVEMHVTKQ